MTVAELIEVLKTQCVPDEPVYIGYDACCVEELALDAIERGRAWELILWAN